MPLKEVKPMQRGLSPPLKLPPTKLKLTKGEINHGSKKTN